MNQTSLKFRDSLNVKNLFFGSFGTILAALLLICTNTAGAAQLNYGKYFGTIQMDGQTESIAVSLDANVVQLNDPATYPALDVIVRANLGGYLSPEYIGFHYYDPTFNFEKGILQLTNPQENLTATLQITNNDKETILEGQVNDRLTNAKGKMRVVMTLFGGKPEMPKEPLVPLLAGEYVGSCGPDLARLQIETGRGIGPSVPGNALSEYSITGRLGYKNGPLCNPARTEGYEYCSLYPYSTGAYSPFAQRLKMQGPLGTIDCTKSKDELKCEVTGNSKKGSCVLKKKSTAATAPVVYPATFTIDVPSGLKEPLPDPLPPGNEALLSSLNGTFYGLLHYENRDLYHWMEMGIVATTSTENQHNENQIDIEPTILLRLGAGIDSSPALSLSFSQRVFWLSPGFALKSESSDYSAVIEEWKMGYVSGVMYSRSYGRIGTFEMIKGSRPKIPSSLVLMPDLTGDYQGPKDAPHPMKKDVWSISIEIPNQNPAPDQTGVPLLGHYVGPGVVSNFDASSFDLNTGALSFLIKKSAGDRIVRGEVNLNKNLKLFWPVGPTLGAPMFPYGAYSYAPKSKKERR